MAVVVAVIVAVLAAVGAFLGVQALAGGDDVRATVDECAIESDGALVASGTVSSDSDLDATVEVRFEDRDTGTEVDRDTVEIDGVAGERIGWSAAGQAGDDVDRVTCVLGPLD